MNVETVVSFKLKNSLLHTLPYFFFALLFTLFISISTYNIVVKNEKRNDFHSLFQEKNFSSLWYKINFNGKLA